MARSNKEVQRWLDKIKYDESSIAKSDKTGKMFYCVFCNHSKSNGCAISQKERVATTACAKAYNKWCSEVDNEN